MGVYKFGKLTGEMEEPFVYPNAWAREKTTGPERLVIAPSANHVTLLLDLAKRLPEPFGILYVLVVSRGGNEPGRYQTPSPIVRSDMEQFVSGFSNYFEGDGRHHIWIASIPESATLVYDHHNVIFAYGPLEAYSEVVRRKGLIEGAVNFPVPHTHRYNKEYDQDEQRIFLRWEWKRFPLENADEY